MKKLALASGILLQLHSYKAQDTVQSRNLKEDIALLNSNTSIQEKTPFLKKEWVKKSVAPTLLFAAAAATWEKRRTSVKFVTATYLPLR